MKSFIAVLVWCAFSAVTAQTVEITCEFVIFVNDYTCRISGADIADSNNQNFVFVGTHTEGRSNADVQRVLILESRIPFVITQLFTTFPNLVRFQVQYDIGMRRVQSNAFANAINLRQIWIQANFGLRSIEANAFSGAPNLSYLSLSNNRIDTIHDSAFEGLRSVQFMWLNGNQIRDLNPNHLRHLEALGWFQASDNLLTTIDGKLFENNWMIQQIGFELNQISAIGRDFLTGRNQLHTFTFSGNKCADFTWFSSTGNTIEILRERLSQCFNNAA